VGTHGRGFWILDNITPLRQLDQTMGTASVLFRSQTAMRVRWNMNTDTPLPPDEPAGENPPDGAMIDFYIAASTERPAQRPVVLEIKDESGQTVRRYSSADPTPTPDPSLAIPSYWLRPPQPLPGKVGMHRFLWDMRYQPVPGVSPTYPIAAIYMNTAPAPTAPWALPGKYTVVLTVNGKSYSQPLVLRMDPRVTTPQKELEEQFKLSKQLYDQWLFLAALAEAARPLRRQMTDLSSRIPEDMKQRFEKFGGELQIFGGGATPGAPGAQPRVTVASVTARLRTLFTQIDGVDLASTNEQRAAAAVVLKDAQTLFENWEAFRTRSLPAFNQELQGKGLPVIAVPK
jgi:hypothetical protein